MRFVYNRPISLRLGLPLALALGPVLLVLLLAFSLDRLMEGLVKRQVQDAFKIMAWQTAEGLDRELFLYYHDALMPGRVMSRNIPAGEPLHVTEVSLSVIKDSSPAFTRLHLVDREGRVTASTDPGARGLDFSGTSWFKQALAEEGSREPEGVLFFPDRRNLGRREVNLATPLIDEEGRLFGVLAIEMDWSWLPLLRDELRLALGLSAESDFLILDRDGGIVLGSPLVTQADVARALSEWKGQRAGTGDSLRRPGTANGAARLAETHSLSELTTIQGVEGNDYLATMAETTGHRNFQGLGWVVLFLKDAEAVYGEARRAETVMLGIALMIALAAALLGWRIASGIASPLGELAETARLVSRGKRDIAFRPDKRFTELRSLSLSLQLLLRMVRRRGRELEEANLNLEARVQERTSEIDMVNGALMNEIEARETLEVERNSLIEDLRKQVRHDPLTGILNRRALMTELEQAVKVARRHQRPLSLVMLDIDHFKQVNDSLGHDVGDEVIIGVTQVCADHTREIDRLARYGGEEFILLAPDTSAEEATALAERVRCAVDEAPIKLANGRAVPVTISLGVAELAAGDDTARLLKRADEALYRAKRSGRNRVAAPPAKAA